MCDKNITNKYFNYINEDNTSRQRDKKNNEKG